MTITMYGADWCKDCRRAKAYFDDHGVAYDYIDLIETPDATDVVLERNNGKQKIPVIIFEDDTHLTEPTNAELEAKLAALGTAPIATNVVSETVAVTNNADAGRFELHEGQELLSFATYSQNGTNLTVPHVETLSAHRGQGNAARLMDGLLANLRENGQTITPLCPFAVGHIADNPQHQDLLG